MVQHQHTSGQWLSQLESAPTFFPTVEQFQDPISYIRSIQTEGSKHGAYTAVAAFGSARDLQQTVLLTLRRHLQNRPAGRSDGAKWAGKSGATAASHKENQPICRCLKKVSTRRCLKKSTAAS